MKEFPTGDTLLSTCQRWTFPWYNGGCFLLSIWIFNLSLYDGLGTKGWGLFCSAAEEEMSKIFGFKYFFSSWLLSSPATGQREEQWSPTWLLSPLWTAEQPKLQLKGERLQCPQAAQMPESSLLLRFWTRLGHPHSALYWVSMGNESSLGIKKLGFGSMNILWLQFLRLLGDNFALDFIRDLSWCSLGHFLGFTRRRQDCG